MHRLTGDRDESRKEFFHWVALKEIMIEENTLQVLTLAMLSSKGIKVARLAGNRDFSEKNIKEKKKSLKNVECFRQLSS